MSQLQGLSLPGAAILTLLAGALFGLLWGLIIVSFASTFGATLAFLASRFLFKEQVQSRFGDRLTAINQGIEKEGKFYLFTCGSSLSFLFSSLTLLWVLHPCRYCSSFGSAS